MTNDVRPPLVIIKKQKIAEDLQKMDMTLPSKEEVVTNLKKKIEELLHMMVEDSDDIKVSVTQGERTTTFVISCEQRNIARILGQKGRHIEAFRTLVMAITGRYGFRAIVEVPYFPK
ncbi:KH domain-containing protein [Bdellovibrio sp.]|uniref:KH domain-containing protein n=1 Tax=Bdellovibrio sp. TaxID=28201 RepID=UPI0039E715D0